MSIDWGYYNRAQAGPYEITAGTPYTKPGVFVVTVADQMGFKHPVHSGHYQSDAMARWAAEKWLKKKAAKMVKALGGLKL